MKKNQGFTLAETLIVLVILGVVASITIPALVRNQMEIQNRTRLRKAMTVYDTVINKMVVENGIKDNAALIREFNNDNCVKSRAYFKPVQNGNDNCTFRTADGIWWNISDINHPLISLGNNEIDPQNLNNLRTTATDTSDKTIYSVVGYIDDNGILRVNDMSKATGVDNDYLEKLYDFANNNKITPEKQFAKCKEKDSETCNVNGIEFKKIEWEDYDYDGDGCWLWWWQKDGQDYCDTLTQTSKIKGDTYYITEVGTGMTWDEAKNYCAQQGATLPNTAQLKQLYLDGKLSSEDGNCNYYSSETMSGYENTGGNSNDEVAVLFCANWEGVTANTSPTSNNLKVICVSK